MLLSNQGGRTGRQGDKETRGQGDLNSFSPWAPFSLSTCPPTPLSPCPLVPLSFSLAVSVSFVVIVAFDGADESAAHGRGHPRIGAAHRLPDDLVEFDVGQRVFFAEIPGGRLDRKSVV